MTVSRSLIILHKRRKVVIPNYTRGLLLPPTINPFITLPPDHDIVRIGRKKEWVLLENDGILQILIKFNISDRKKLGVHNKVRKLSLDYKVVTNNLKTVLNDFIVNGYSTPIGPPYFAGVKGLSQTFAGTYNGVPLRVTVPLSEFGTNFSARIGETDNSDNYLKIVTYKFHQAWLSVVNQPGFEVPEPRENIGSAPVNNSAVQFVANDVITSSGLFLFKTTQKVFDTSATTVAEPIDHFNRHFRSQKKPTWKVVRIHLLKLM